MRYYFDTLPLHPPPEPLESFTCYLMRLAEMNKIKHTEKLASICLPNQNIHALRTQRDYPPKSFREMQQATTWDEEVLRKTTFYHVGTNLGRSMEPTSLSRFMSSSVSSHLRYCPICIADYSYYFLPWRFLTLNGSYRHSCQLLDRCGHCEYLIPFLSPLLRAGSNSYQQASDMADLTRRSAPVQSRKTYSQAYFERSFLSWSLSYQPLTRLTSRPLARSSPLTPSCNAIGVCLPCWIGVPLIRQGLPLARVARLTPRALSPKPFSCVSTRRKPPCLPCAPSCWNTLCWCSNWAFAPPSLCRSLTASMCNAPCPRFAGSMSNYAPLIPAC